MASPTILVSGAGQLGSRYLQGLAKCSSPLDIHVQDVREESLRAAGERWSEARGPECAHRLSFARSLESLPRALDVAIVATTADARPDVVGEIAAHCSVRYWILEKVLAQSESGLERLKSHVGASSRAWVNTPRRIMPWHREIKSRLAAAAPLTLELEGGEWGLACNAVHFLDLLAWWSGESLREVSAERLDAQWFESKRPRFFEVSGTLEARYSRGSRALLTARGNGASVSLAVRQGGEVWHLDETQGIARRSDGVEIRGRLPYQSEMTADLVESILAQGDCGLPALEDSIATHRVLLRALQEHWQRAGHAGATSVPIT